jgi:hypothetical protein
MTRVGLQRHWGGGELYQELACYGLFQFMSRLKALLSVELHESKNA